MADNETIADIIAWLRKPREGENAYLTLWRDEIADRLEAAHKRDAVTDCNQFSDAAKLREALEYMFILIDERHLVLECETTEEISGVQGKLAEALAALAAPPRNCDKVKTSWDVLKKWHEGLDTANDIVRMLDWLLAPATEKEGARSED